MARYNINYIGRYVHIFVYEDANIYLAIAIESRCSVLSSMLRLRGDIINENGTVSSVGIQDGDVL